MTRRIQSLKKAFTLQRKKEKIKKEFQGMNLLGRERYIDNEALPIYERRDMKYE